MNRRAQLAGVAATALLLTAAAGCGDDDDDAAAEYEAFCAAELAVERAGNEEDLEALEPAFAALAEATPEEAQETVERTIAAAQEMFAAEEEAGPSEEFEVAYSEMIAIVKDKCGYNEIDVEGEEYSFSGLDDSLDADPSVITFENTGSELHEFSVVRKNDGVTLSAEELLELPEDEAGEMVTFVGTAFAFPGETGYTVVDLEPGDYVAVCFIPVGLTPAAMEEMEASGEEPEGAPHFTEGMVAEFEVT